ncbi:MAG TPA: sialidase family protein [Lentisphaeria bacterium]|nr:sialidase family protein [Lentisphaeria bacterium]
MDLTSADDWRDIAQGRVIPSDGYCDQPYIVKTDDGAWLCCLTTGSRHEGAPGQHVVTMRSFDQGRTWSAPVKVEPDCELENSYAVMLKANSGRIYIFYGHNSDNVRSIVSHDGQSVFTRVDSLGYYVFKYSDDHGRSWSRQRHVVPVRAFQCDRENVYQGNIRFFWNVGRPFVHDGSAYIPLIKVGRMGAGFFAQSEGALLRSVNLLSETDPEKISFETLPDGDVGLRSPAGGGPVAEEQSYVVLSDGSFCVSYRGIDGYGVESYSRDGGRTWSAPQYRQTASGRRMKNPRAANFTWKCENGKYLYWFHNHGGHFIRDFWARPSLPNGDCSYYDDRNPAWLCGGREEDSPEGKIIVWSEPELVLYDRDPFIRISYPDLVEEDGNFFLTETQKNIARVHPIPAAFLEKIWQGMDGACPTPTPLLDTPGPWWPPAMRLPSFFVRNSVGSRDGGVRPGGGFSLQLELRPDAAGMLLDGLDHNDYGFAVRLSPQRELELVLSDPWGKQVLASPPLPEQAVVVTILVDGGPALVSFVADGCFLDGGEDRQFGFQRLASFLRHPNWVFQWTLSKAVANLRVFNRCLMTAECR